MCPQVSIDIPNAFHDLRLNIETASAIMDSLPFKLPASTRGA
jgi:hypothetical protein